MRHDGNEQAFANGGLSEGGRHIPAIGVGGSSGSTLDIVPTKATSVKGGGIYIHTAQSQAMPFRANLRGCEIGGDSLVDPDLIVTTLGSTTADTIDIDGLTMSIGVMAYGVSAIPPDPMKNFAAHTDIKIHGRNISPHI